MTAYQPLISVTLPNYNYGRFLAQSFDSILTQTYENLEILFTDDGSTDDSIEIARRYAAKDSRIKAVYFEKNQGAMAAHGNAWNRVTGEIIYQFSSDDYITDADFFRCGVKLMTAYPRAAGFFGLADIIVIETGLKSFQMGKAEPSGYITPEAFLHGFLTQEFFVPGISSMWRKRHIDAVGEYDKRLGPQADYFINHVLPARAGVVYAPAVVAHARTSSQTKSYSASASLEDELKRLALFSSKMRSHTARSGASEADWNCWRNNRANYLITKYGAACREPTSQGSLADLG